MDTEEIIDLKFYRPLGYQWALFFEKRGITPNTISILSIFLGVTAGILFYYEHFGLNLLGILFLIWANMYDSADGQLARMTQNFSRIGRMLDGACGDIWFITIYIALCLRLTPEWGIKIWFLGAFAGYWHSKQSTIADYYRNFHLFFLKGKKGSELDDSTQIEAEFKALSFTDEPIYKLFLWFYKGYTQTQERFTPAMQAFRVILRAKFGDEGIPSQLRTAFLAQSKPLMKYGNMLTFNTRVIVLCVSILINKPWIYFVFEATILNGMLLYMITTHERICRSFGERIDTEFN